MVDLLPGAISESDGSDVAGGGTRQLPVAIIRTGDEYPSDAPYDPHVRYPEYIGKRIAKSRNAIYEGVRNLLRDLGFDAGNYGTSHWNPLGHIVKPGDRVFIKPNFVTHEYRVSCGEPGDLFAVVTHPSVIRAVADYVAIALDGEGEIILGDNPSIDADFAKLTSRLSLHELAEVYAHTGIAFRIMDLRPLRTPDLSVYGFKHATQQCTGDPEGRTVMNLGKESYFYDCNPLLFRGVFLKRWETIKHHHWSTQEYSFSNTILNSDVYISLPKLKTHRKVGVTLNIKGLVGIMMDKNYLIHWRIGFPALGGDEFPPPTRWLDYALLAVRHLLIDVLPEKLLLRLKRALSGTCLKLLLDDTRCLSHSMPRGGWQGNDTCWRMAADIYNAFIADKTQWRAKRGRSFKTFSVVDGVMAGEGNGPFCPRLRRAGVLIAGENLLHVDCVGSRLMDFDLSRIGYLRNLANEVGLQARPPVVFLDGVPQPGFFGKDHTYLEFDPPDGWPDLPIKREPNCAVDLRQISGEPKSG